MAMASFVAGLWIDAKHVLTQSFSNDGAGFKQLVRWLKSHGFGVMRVGIESTNTYGQALAQWLHDRGFTVHILNPEQTAYYARCQGQRNKTDPADARSIAAYVAKHELTPWLPPSPEQLTLRQLTRVRQQLVETNKQLLNQIRTAGPAAKQHLQPVQKRIKQQLAAVEQDIRKHLNCFPLLKEQVHRLMTLKGVGLTTAAVLVAELPKITEQSDPRAICAWCGLTPKRYQSGKQEWRTFLSRRGNAYVRQALYMPALVALRFNPLLHRFAQRLLDAGKKKPAVIGAVAHKMLRILVGLLKHRTAFDPNWSAAKS